MAVPGAGGAHTHTHTALLLGCGAARRSFLGMCALRPTMAVTAHAPARCTHTYTGRGGFGRAGCAMGQRVECSASWRDGEHCPMRMARGRQPDGMEGDRLVLPTRRRPIYGTRGSYVGWNTQTRALCGDLLRSCLPPIFDGCLWSGRETTPQTSHEDPPPSENGHDQRGCALARSLLVVSEREGEPVTRARIHAIEPRVPWATVTDVPISLLARAPQRGSERAQL